jgi:hypothetical protein
MKLAPLSTALGDKIAVARHRDDTLPDFSLRGTPKAVVVVTRLVILGPCLMAWLRGKASTPEDMISASSPRFDDGDPSPLADGRLLHCPLSRCSADGSVLSSDAALRSGPGGTPIEGASTTP